MHSVILSVCTTKRMKVAQILKKVVIVLCLCSSSFAKSFLARGNSVIKANKFIA